MRYLNSKVLVSWLIALSAVNVGLSAVVGVNLVDSVFSTGSVLSKVVYGLIGVAGLWKVYHLAMGKKK